MNSDSEEVSHVVTPPPSPIVTCQASWLWSGFAGIAVCTAGAGTILCVAQIPAPPALAAVRYLLSALSLAAVATLPTKAAEAWHMGDWGRAIACFVLWSVCEFFIAYALLIVVAAAPIREIPSSGGVGIPELWPFVCALTGALLAGLLPYAVTGRRPKATTSTVNVQHDKRPAAPAQQPKPCRPAPSVRLTPAQRAIAELCAAVCRGDKVAGVRLLGVDKIAFTQAAQARHLGLAKSTVNAGLKRLAELGIVVRHRASRATVVTLVAKQWLPDRAAGDDPSGCADIKAPARGPSSSPEHPLPGYATCNQVHAPPMSLHPLKSGQASFETISIR